MILQKGHSLAVVDPGAGRRVRVLEADLVEVGSTGPLDVFWPPLGVSLEPAQAAMAVRAKTEAQVSNALSTVSAPHWADA